MGTMAPERVVQGEASESILSGLDFDHAVVCDVAALRKRIREWALFFAGPPCPGSPAEWRAIRNCCGATNLLCTKCKDWYIQTHSWASFSCLMCGNHPWQYAYVEELRHS